MVRHFHPTYKDRIAAITDLITHFETKGERFDKRKRNSLKLFDLDEQTINVKSFKVPNIFNKIAYRYLRDSKAKRSFEFATILEEKGIGTPQPIAYFEEEGLLFGRSFYVSEHLKYDLTYRELVKPSPYKGNVDILQAFSKFTYELHQKGVLFLDHSPGNTLIKIHPDHTYSFYLVDLNRMRFADQLTFKERMLNFNRLSPHIDDVRIMAEAYALESNEAPALVFEAMWEGVQNFQEGFRRKKALKKKLKFWKK